MVTTTTGPAKSSKMAKLPCTPSTKALSALVRETKKLVNPASVKNIKLSPQQVYQHFSEPSQLLSPITSSFSCMDFKGQRPIIGTPGGDFGEFLLAYNVFNDFQGRTETTYETVRGHLAEFITQHCSPDRPFYKHTDAARITRLQDQMGVKSFPVSRPKNLNQWFQSLVDPEMHGCGHLRSILTDVGPYKISRTLADNVLCAFYDLHWHEDYRAMTFLEVLPHPTELTTESGLVIHDHSCAAQPDCNHAFIPHHEGHGIFTLNLTSQKVFRNKVIIPFFVQRLQNITAAQFAVALSERYMNYWKATGGYLNLLTLPMMEIKNDGYIL